MPSTGYPPKSRVSTAQTPVAPAPPAGEQAAPAAPDRVESEAAGTQPAADERD
ncbi:hypothetical protein GCM10020229_62480 [Kitasatospora albolonga]|uniref:hypothetical protein n=1 Tax=Kitasatospora albolonga TaxID=68173 RepID=UPI0031E9A2F9